eukprot:gene4292-6632_t
MPVVEYTNAELKKDDEAQVPLIVCICCEIAEKNCTRTQIPDDLRRYLDGKADLPVLNKVCKGISSLGASAVRKDAIRKKLSQAKEPGGLVWCALARFLDNTKHDVDPLFPRRAQRNLFSAWAHSYWDTTPPPDDWWDSEVYLSEVEEWATNAQKSKSYRSEVTHLMSQVESDYPSRFGTLRRIFRAVNACSSGGKDLARIAHLFCLLQHKLFNADPATDQNECSEEDLCGWGSKNIDDQCAEARRQCFFCCSIFPEKVFFTVGPGGSAQHADDDDDGIIPVRRPSRQGSVFERSDADTLFFGSTAALAIAGAAAVMAASPQWRKPISLSSIRDTLNEAAVTLNSRRALSDSSAPTSPQENSYRSTERGHARVSDPQLPPSTAPLSAIAHTSPTSSNSQIGSSRDLTDAGRLKTDTTTHDSHAFHPARRAPAPAKVHTAAVETNTGPHQRKPSSLRNKSPPSPKAPQRSPRAAIVDTSAHTEPDPTTHPSLSSSSSVLSLQKLVKLVHDVQEVVYLADARSVDTERVVKKLSVTQDEAVQKFAILDDRLDDDADQRTALEAAFQKLQEAFVKQLGENQQLSQNLSVVQAQQQAMTRMIRDLQHQAHEGKPRQPYPHSDSNGTTDSPAAGAVVLQGQRHSTKQDVDAPARMRSRKRSRSRSPAPAPAQVGKGNLLAHSATDSSSPASSDPQADREKRRDKDWEERQNPLRQFDYKAYHLFDIEKDVQSLRRENRSLREEVDAIRRELSRVKHDAEQATVDTSRDAQALRTGGSEGIDPPATVRIAVLEQDVDAIEETHARAPLDLGSAGLREELSQVKHRMESNEYGMTEARQDLMLVRRQFKSLEDKVQQQNRLLQMQLSSGNNDAYVAAKIGAPYYHQQLTELNGKLQKSSYY